jgi:hypothetical protein
LKSNPIVEEWLAHGIPDGSAQLIYETKRQTEQGEDIIRIYRWMPRRNT